MSRFVPVSMNPGASLPRASGRPSRPGRTLAALTVLLAAAWLGGCSLATGGGGQEAAPVVLRVENEYASDVQITAIRSGGRVWREQVRLFENRAFEVQGGDLTHATIRFLLEPRGTTSSYLTTGVAIRPGDVVILHIDKELRRSSALLQ